MSARGYVVRGTDDDGEAWATYEKASVSGWRTHTAATESRRDATLFETSDEAARSAADFRERFTGVTIFAVAEDGTEVALPSYGETLATLDATAAAIFADALPRTDLPSLVKQYANICEDAAAEAERGRIPDPLAALEAAEQRLLEDGGWTEHPTLKGSWIEGKHGHAYKADTAIRIERENRRLAAKGGT